MAGITLGGGTTTSPYGVLAGRAPAQGGVPTGVSNAARGYASAPSWTPFTGNVLGLRPGSPEAAAAAAQLNQTYAQGDIQRGMQQGQQGFERSMSEQRRGWNLEDQNTAYSWLNALGGGAAGGGPRVTGEDTSWDASLAAAMGKAKDTAAQAVGAARKALGSNMTARGIGGSGIEAKNERAIQLAGAGQIGAAGREMATQTAARRAAVNDRNYAGDITQRGQDITAQGQRLSLLPSLTSLLRVAY